MRSSRALLVPLDDRPCNLRFPVQLGRIAPCQVLTAPRNLLGGLHVPGDSETLIDWLWGLKEMFGVAILSLDMICYGGLVASRTPRVPLSLAMERLEKIVRWKESRAGLPVVAFNVITRLSITVSSNEAARYHEFLNRYAQVVDQAAVEDNDGLLEEAQRLREQIPSELLSEYLQARERNHQVNRRAVECVRNQIFDYLILCQEDCSAFGFHRKEQAVLQRDIDEQEVVDVVHLYPGADEAASTLLARHLLKEKGVRPAVRVVHSDAAGARRIPPFEDRELAESVRLRIASAGALEAAPQGKEDLLLFVNACENMTREEAADPIRRDERAHQLSPFVEEIAEAVASGRPVAIADVAFPNGGDPVLVELLLKHVRVARLLSYAAWNTAGNTIGTALAHSLIRWLSRAQDPREAEPDLSHYEFLFERFIDDWASQGVIRRELESLWARPREVSIFNLDDSAGEAEEYVVQRLTPYVEEIFGQHFQRLLGLEPLQWSVTLPWKRSFECDLRVSFRKAVAANGPA